MNEELIKRAENAIGIMEDSSNTTADEDYLCEIIRELLAALSQPADGWKDIASAPKDGTEIILFGTSPENPHRVTAGFWIVPPPQIIGDCGGSCRCPEYDEAEEKPYWSSNDGGFTEEYPPTKWQPLPQPPKGE